MPDQPLIVVQYRKATTGRLSNGRSARRIGLAPEDVRLLRILAGKPILVKLQCPGSATFHVRLDVLLTRLRWGEDARMWYISVDTGSLVRVPETKKTA